MKSVTVLSLPFFCQALPLVPLILMPYQSSMPSVTARQRCFFVPSGPEPRLFMGRACRPLSTYSCMSASFAASSHIFPLPPLASRPLSLPPPLSLSSPPFLSSLPTATPAAAAAAAAAASPGCALMGGGRRSSPGFMTAAGVVAATDIKREKEEESESDQRERLREKRQSEEQREREKNKRWSTSFQWQMAQQTSVFLAMNRKRHLRPSDLDLTAPARAALPFKAHLEEKKGGVEIPEKGQKNGSWDFVKSQRKISP